MKFTSNLLLLATSAMCSEIASEPDQGDLKNSINALATRAKDLAGFFDQQPPSGEAAASVMPDEKVINTFKQDAFAAICEFVDFLKPLFDSHFKIESQMEEDERSKKIEELLSKDGEFQKFEEEISKVSKEAKEMIEEIQKNTIEILKNGKDTPIKNFLLDKENFPEPIHDLLLKLSKNEKDCEKKFENNLPGFIENLGLIKAGKINSITSESGDFTDTFYLGGAFLLGVITCILAVAIIKQSKDEDEDKKEDSSAVSAGEE